MGRNAPGPRAPAIRAPWPTLASLRPAAQGKGRARAYVHAFRKSPVPCSAALAASSTKIFVSTALQPAATVAVSVT
eukprot:CAMPEP_0206396326 /NCGR_PEP_ID=MMETSP0294-20121207/22715_1 /ASSEMBLY_ACC=CAM_ASM_000327 /TAXON_ID=39354 /ORGANISM="Heterosigma akashiwo, Strain CCMP2393" /LENGTH=75 /DNA_ID=CAMNT_0053851029 /DNA_START=112 /DNA_END=335 /DNA_ORIENTATION=+